MNDRLSTEGNRDMDDYNIKLGLQYCVYIDIR